MLRWLIGATAAIVIVVAAMLMVLSEPNREPQADRDPWAIIDAEAPAPPDSALAGTGPAKAGAADQRPGPAVPGHPTAPVDSTPSAPSRSQPTESQRDPASAGDLQIRPPAPQGPIEVLRRVYQQESRDATSRSIELLIRKQLGPEFFPSDLIEDVDCRKSVCKIDVLWHNEQPMVLAGVAMRVGPLLSGHIGFDPAPEPDRDGYFVVEMYILRAGYELPELE